MLAARQIYGQLVDLRFVEVINLGDLLGIVVEIGQHGLHLAFHLRQIIVQLVLHFLVLFSHLVDYTFASAVKSVAIAFESTLDWLKFLVEQSLVLELAATVRQSVDAVVLDEVLRMRYVHVGAENLLDMVPELEVSLL